MQRPEWRCRSLPRLHGWNHSHQLRDRLSTGMRQRRLAQQKGVPGRTLPGHSLSFSRRIVTKALRSHVQGYPSCQAALAHHHEGNISPCDGESWRAFAFFCVRFSCDLYLISWFPFASTFWGRLFSGGEPSSLTPFQPLFNVVSTEYRWPVLFHPRLHECSTTGKGRGRRKRGQVTKMRITVRVRRVTDPFPVQPEWHSRWHISRKTACDRTLESATSLSVSLQSPSTNTQFRRPVWILNMRIAFSATLLLASTTLSGCDGFGSSSRGVASTGWSRSTVGEPEVPGITTAEVATGTIDGQPVVTFWTSGGSGLASTADSSSGGTRFSTSRTLSDSTEFELSCVTVDGKTGTVQIAGQKFDLADGSLFLVASPDDKVIVRQLALKLPERPSAFDSAAGQEYSSTLQRIAREEAQIRDFFTEMHRAATPAEAESPDGDQ